MKTKRLIYKEMESKRIATIEVWSTTEQIEGTTNVVKIERFVITGNEYDGMTYKFSFPDGYEIVEANEWFRRNDYNYDGHAPGDDDLYDFTPMHWYSIGRKFVGTQVVRTQPVSAAHLLAEPLPCGQLSVKCSMPLMPRLLDRRLEASCQSLKMFTLVGRHILR